MKREIEMLLVTVLSEREARVLRLHFGLNGEVPLSCEEIGRQLKLSRERVRQINNIALSKLRQTSIVNSLRMYIHQQVLLHCIGNEFTTIKEEKELEAKIQKIISNNNKREACHKFVFFILTQSFQNGRTRVMILCVCGSRTLVYCLEGNYPNRWTTNA